MNKLEIAWLLTLLLAWARVAEPQENSPERTKGWWKAVSEPS